MRKLTGYIGAMIIVFALAGSVLAGYALNINGQSTVINEYETVTDVSGLYSYSEQKNYIDYNPASNYIGYSVEQSSTFTINNPSDLGNNGLYYNVYTDTTANGAWNRTQYPSGAFYNNGTIVNRSTGGDQTGSTVYPIATGEKLIVYIYNPNSTKYIATITEWSTGVTNNYTSGNFTISYTSGTITMVLDGSTTITSSSDWLAIPANGGNYSIMEGVGRSGYYQTGQFYEVDGNHTTITSIDEYNGQPTYNLYTATITRANEWSFIISTMEYIPTLSKGVNYTESNRVNNYPMEIDPSDISYSYGTITLSSLTATDYWPVSPINVPLSDAVLMYNVRIDPNYNFNDWIRTPQYSANSSSSTYYQDVNHNYKLSDIISTISIPSNTKTIRINANGNGYYNTAMNNYSVNIDNNMAGFTNMDEYQTGQYVSYNNIYGKKDYVVYDLDNNIASIYDYTGVKKSSNTPDRIMVTFVINNGNNNYSEGYSRYSNGNNGGYQEWGNYSGRPSPYLNLEFERISDESIKYIDITKGIAIKPSNVSNTVWYNGYENGAIEILFRAADISQNYHNDISISNNLISVNYSSSRYYITLNGGDSIDIGTWRSIVLNVDLVKGELSVTPVRTFNSFTNVQLDKTEITIGNLIGAAPTSTLSLSPTTNSLMFNIYSTSVFMNTYGVVMANPTLDITDYFTNLDNFYKLKLTNFSIYGDSITVNGETYQIDGNKLMVGDESLIIKDLSIIYADNHAYLEDSHISIDIGEITNNTISMAGAWYFQTELLKGYTAQKMVYDWDWTGFIFDNTEFCIIYIGLAIAGLLIARRYCTLSMIDYAVFLVSLIIALGVQVIA